MTPHSERCGHCGEVVSRGRPHACPELRLTHDCEIRLNSWEMNELVRWWAANALLFPDGSRPGLGTGMHVILRSKNTGIGAVLQVIRKQDNRKMYEVADYESW